MKKKKEKKKRLTVNGSVCKDRGSVVDIEDMDTFSTTPTQQDVDPQLDLSLTCCEDWLHAFSSILFQSRISLF